MLDPIETLYHRKEFIENIRELALLCNWKEKEVLELEEQLWDELVIIDNDTLYVLEVVGTEEAHRVWELGMENIRYWLSLILGIKIKFV